ncbi:restriction endonuclease subunit S [Listeria seeligeri]|uniref:restriction endonuclease subunit S n=1 Tax=Listeria seeligeri TaxID=1640 RepID=UPI0022EB98C9|nr:restriction endonuclease subunit S [Listeria seeligeri]
MKGERKTAPVIRFKGFSDAWEQRKLGYIADVTKLAGFEFTKYIIYQETGKIIALRGLNVKNGNLVLDDIKYIDESDFSKLKRSKLYKNDILFTYVGTVGELAIVPEDDRYYLAPNVARIRLNSDSSPIFVSQMMNGSTFYKRIIFPLIATSSQPALSMENVRKFDLMIPTEPEQQKIGAFFKQLDNTIALHQRKLDALKLLKKGFLQQMFSESGGKAPRLRFADFEEKYKQCKFIDIVTRINKSSNSIELPKVEFEDIHAGEGRLLNNVANKFDNRKGIEFKPNDILYGKLRPYLKNWLMPNFCGVALGDFWVFRAKNCDPKFIYSFIQSTLYQKAANDTKGTKMPRSDWEKVSNTKFLIPKDIVEQSKIGGFFKQLDNIILLRQKNLEKIISSKKAYLQKMFM